MLLKITHETDLNYTDLISESVIELRMAPRQEQDQHRLAFSLAVGPATQITSYFDWLGNTVHAFSISAFHNNIRIVATSVVETDRPEIDPTRFNDSWPMAEGDNDYSIYDYRQFGGPVVDSPLLQKFISDLKPEKGMPLGQLSMRMLRLIQKRFTYTKGITNAASPITEMLEHGQGVCQDFTHLMVGLARAMKIPARYVSGLLHPNQGSDLRGFTQTHAWCELLFPSVGWIGFDAANSCVAGGNFVKVAVGRDYRDVPPNKGLFRGTAKESISVDVQSEELKAIPNELAAERYHQIQVPVYPAGSQAHREFVNQQREQQQQQQQA